MEPEGSLPHSQESATCLYPRPAQSSPYTHIPPPEELINQITKYTVQTPSWELNSSSAVHGIVIFVLLGRYSSVSWWLVTDVAAQPIGPISIGQTVHPLTVVTLYNIPAESRSNLRSLEARNHAGQEVPRTYGTLNFNTAFPTPRNLPPGPISPVLAPY